MKDGEEGGKEEGEEGGKKEKREERGRGGSSSSQVPEFYGTSATSARYGREKFAPANKQTNTAVLLKTS